MARLAVAIKSKRAKSASAIVDGNCCHSNSIDAEFPDDTKKRPDKGHCSMAREARLNRLAEIIDEGSPSGRADQDLYLRNAWYVGAWATEVERGLLPRTVLGERLVLWRTEAGEAIAMGDTCPHRFAPLHRGQLIGDAIECPYHGLRFGPAGRCVLNPHGDTIPAALRVPAIPVVERYGLIWLWMGDPAKANPALIPDFSFFDDPKRPKGQVGYLLMKANYQLIIDNLLDLTHTQFLHSSSLGSAAMSGGDLTVLVEGDTVHSNRLVPNALAPPQFERRYPLNGQPVDHWLDMRWDPPGVMRLTAGVGAPGAPRDEGWEGITAHLVTPETDTTSHYFFGGMLDPRANRVPSDYRRPDGKPEVHEAHPFLTEDGPMLELQQSRMGTPDLMSLKPVLLASDAAAMRARGVLNRRLKAEAAEPAQRLSRFG